jgi:hypothetical protein
MESIRGIQDVGCEFGRMNHSLLTDDTDQLGLYLRNIRVHRATCDGRAGANLTSIAIGILRPHERQLYVKLYVFNLILNVQQNRRLYARPTVAGRIVRFLMANGTSAEAAVNDEWDCD